VVAGVEIDAGVTPADSLLAGAEKTFGYYATGAVSFLHNSLPNQRNRFSPLMLPVSFSVR